MGELYIEFTYLYPATHLAVKDEVNKKVLKVSTFISIARPELELPIFVYMKRDGSCDYCQDWWDFSNKFDCLGHKYKIVGLKDMEDRGENEVSDQNIEHLLQEKKFLKQVTQETHHNLRTGLSFYDSKIYSLLDHIINFQD